MRSGLPVMGNERSDILDILRGFALLGIFLANSAAFSLYVMRTPGMQAELATAEADRWLFWLHYIFIDGKFYSLFSLLFGIGFSIIFLRNSNKGINPLPVFYRRLVILFLIGFAHAFILWEGDILMFYAVIGLFLPLFRNLKGRTLITIAVCLLLSPLLFDLAKVLTGGRWDLSKPILEQAMAGDLKYGINETNASYWLIENTRLSDLLIWNKGGFWWNTFFRISSNRPVKVLALFLIGLYVGKNMIYSKLEDYRSLLRKIRLVGFTIGIPAGIFHAYSRLNGKALPDPEGLWDTLFYALNVTPLALAYASTFALWYVNGKHLKLLSPLRHVGRMALTNYLMQSVIGILVYYGLGLGLGAFAGPAIFMPIAVGVFIFQVLYSKLWMKYFHYGPAEWIWRQLTYFKRLPILRK